MQNNPFAPVLRNDTDAPRFFWWFSRRSVLAEAYATLDGPADAARSFKAVAARSPCSIKCGCGSRKHAASRPQDETSTEAVAYAVGCDVWLERGRT